MLRLHHVYKTYREGALVVEALRDVDLAIGEERFTMIVGPSGSGKTTLLNLLGTIDKPTRGRVEIDGIDVGTLDDRQLTAFRAARIGFIFQAFNLLPVLTAYENVEYALLQSGVGKKERESRTLELLEAVDLRSFAKHRPNQLSGGQRQRVAIARALVKNPRLVLADEPTANLDSAIGGAIVNLMRRMQKQFRTTFVFSTHDAELMRHADEILHTRDGVVTTRSAREPEGALS